MNAPSRARSTQAPTPPMTHFTPSPEFSDQLDALFRLRRDVRRFRPDPVPKALLEETFATFDTAPSVGLSQPWRLAFFDSADARQAARAAFESANSAALSAQSDADAALYASLKLEGMDQAPVQFAVFCDEACVQGRGLGRATMPEMLRYSVVCALMQLWLAARARGLGLGWVSILDVEAITRVVRAPAAWRLIGYFCLGWPEENSETPELAQAGWERRRATPRADHIRL